MLLRWTPFLIFAALALLYTEGVKAAVRRWPGSTACWARWLVW